MTGAHGYHPPRPRLGPGHLGFVAFVLLAFGGASGVLWLGRNASFWHDECDFLHHRSLAEPLSLFVPHNDHAVVIPAAAYRAVVDLFGTESYVPFLALVLVAHVATATGLLAMLAPRSIWLGLGAATLFLFFGSGAENLFWGFQITFVGSTAFGVWALWAAERDRWRLAAAMLAASVFCSLIGVAFVVAAGVIGLLDKCRGVAWVSLPLILLAAWWMAFGLGWERPSDWAVYEYGSAIDVNSWRLVPRYILQATFLVGSAVSGFPIALAFLLVCGALGLLLWALLRGWRPSPFQLGIGLSYLTFTTMAGIVRAASATTFVPRFIYVAALLMLLLLPTVPRTRVAVMVAGALFAVAIASNVFALVAAADFWTARASGPLACEP